MTACNRRSPLRFVRLALCVALVACTLHSISEAEAAPKKPKTATTAIKKKPKTAAAEPVIAPEPEPLPEPEPRKEEPKKEEATKEPTPTTATASTTLSTPTATTPKDTPPIVPVPKTRTLEPGHVDLKLTGNADALLAFMGAGAAADIGVIRGGPGTFALGAAGEYNFCASICWLLNTITPLEFGQHEISLWARASYHIDIKGTGMQKLDVFPFVMAGPTFANSYVRLDNGALEYRGHDRAIAVGGGLGANLFVAGPVFIGGEARIRYAQGVYTYELVSGSSSRPLAEGSVSTWSMTGLDVMLAMGFRL